MTDTYGNVEAGDCFMVGWSWAQVYAPGLLPADPSIVGPVLAPARHPDVGYTMQVGAITVSLREVELRDWIASRGGDAALPPVGRMVVDPRTVISPPVAPVVREAFAQVQRAFDRSIMAPSPPAPQAPAVDVICRSCGCSKTAPGADGRCLGGNSVLGGHPWSDGSIGDSRAVPPG